MGHKIQTFTAGITNPLTLYTFEVQIPSIKSDYPLFIQSTQYPTQGEFGEIKLWHQGLPIRYPALPDVGGKWEFEIPESDDGRVAAVFDKLNKQMFNQQAGVMIPTVWKTVTLLQKNLAGEIVFRTVLHGAWFARRQPQNLTAQNNNDSWKHRYTFVYNWLEDKKVGGGTGAEDPLTNEE